MSSNPTTLLAAALAACSVLSLGAPAFADHVSPLTVEALPTSVTIGIAGKTGGQVLSEVRQASATVCFNAELKGELGFYGDDRCSIRTTDAAMAHYRQIIASNPEALALLTVKPAG
jgi:hypothetical protein